MASNEFSVALDVKHGDLMPTIKDSDDYGGMGFEEFSRRIQSDNDARYGDVIRNASWEDIDESGW